MPSLPQMGFAKPGRAKQVHVFRLSGGRSLCGKILGFRGMPVLMVLDPEKILKASPGDCLHCVKVFNAVMLEHKADKTTPGAGGT